jgi:probable lipoprotein NlpC
MSTACPVSRPGRAILVGVLALLLPAAALAAPVASASPKAARSRLIAEARTWEGTPYRLGGLDAAGLDCSGLVYRVYADALGLSVPRTVRGLFSYIEPVTADRLQAGDLVFFNTTGPLAHVGIYTGEGRFIHAASEGSPRGVTEASLEEEYWRRAWAGGGRILPPAVFFGVIISIAGGPRLGATEGAGLRGLDLSASAAYPLGGLELGLDLRPSWDGALGVLRLPAAFSFGLDSRLRFFFGPVLTLGAPRLSTAEGERDYAAGGSWLATAGLSWTPFSLPLGSGSLGFYGQLVYDRYEAIAAAADPGLDATARLSAGFGLRYRFYI